MTDWLIFVLLLVGVPAAALLTLFRWLSVEYALVFVWAVVFLCFATGFLRMWQGTPETEGVSVSSSARRQSVS